MNAIKKAEQDVIKHQLKQLKIINITCFIALYRFGWDADKIIERFNQATDIWNECKENHSSTLELLEQETGIELMLDGEKTYHDFTQLRYVEREVTPAQYIYSLYRRKRWIAPLILGCILIALHRVDGWEYDELSAFIIETDMIRKTCGEDVEKYEEAMAEETGYTPRLWGD